MIRKKICLIGEFSVGKTSLIRRFVEDRFDDRYLSSIGAKVTRAVIPLEVGAPHPEIGLLIWDLAGGERFDSVMHSYYSGASGAFLVCDLTRHETADALLNYAHDFWSVNPKTPLVVLGNKADLSEQRAISDEQLAQITQQIHAPVLLTSAKTGANVQAAFTLIAQRLLGS